MPDSAPDMLSEDERRLIDGLRQQCRHFPTCAEDVIELCDIIDRLSSHLREPSQVASPDDQQNDGADELPAKSCSRVADQQRVDTIAETDNGRGVTSAGGESGLPHRATTLRDEINEIRENTNAILAHLRERDRGTNEMAIVEIAGRRFTRNVRFTSLYPGQRWLRLDPDGSLHYAGCDEWLDRIASLEAQLAARTSDPRGSETPWFCSTAPHTAELPDGDGPLFDDATVSSMCASALEVARLEDVPGSASTTIRRLVRHLRRERWAAGPRGVPLSGKSENAVQEPS